jgi:hypothetical protein
VRPIGPGLAITSQLVICTLPIETSLSILSCAFLAKFTLALGPASDAPGICHHIRKDAITAHNSADETVKLNKLISGHISISETFDQVVTLKCIQKFHQHLISAALCLSASRSLIKTF